MKITSNELDHFETRYKVALINSLAGYRQAVLIGTKSLDGVSNLTIFNSLIHLGSSPALFGLICRPDSVRRDTLSNILDTKEYTLNYIASTDFEKAHQSSAKYDASISEFNEVGFTEEYLENFNPPFVKEAKVKFAMKLVDTLEIKANATILLIGSIQWIDLEEQFINKDGFVGLEKMDILACAGLDAYYKPAFIGRLSYPKPGSWPTKLE